jgi:hypothetical protein
MRAFLAAGVAILAVACGAGQGDRPRVADDSERWESPRPVHRTKRRAKVAREEPRAQSELPRSCSSAGRHCVPPEDFVAALCQKKYPGVAIAMFEKSAPWQHVFVKVADVAPVNVLGGPTGETRLEFLEEVVVLRRRVIQYGEMEVSVPDSFDVLRLDGTCASLAEDEFMSHRPAVRPKYAPVVWQQIDGATREVLEQNERVEQAREGQYHACRGSFLGGGGVECREATQKLARAIMTVLGQGITLPAPNELPEWSPRTAMRTEAKASD